LAVGGDPWVVGDKEEGQIGALPETDQQPSLATWRAKHFRAADVISGL